MIYALKTADDLGLYLDAKTKQPVFVAAPAKASEFWLVNDVVPDGASRIGWELRNGVVEPVLRKLAEKPPFDPGLEKLVAGEVTKVGNDFIQAWEITPLAPAEKEVLKDSEDLALLVKIGPSIEDGTASPDVIAILNRIVYHDMVRRLLPLTVK